MTDYEAAEPMAPEGFDFEAALITDILDNKTIRTCVKWKITADFLFGTQTKAAYLYLLQWFANPNYGDTPSWESFQHSFPDFAPLRVEESTVALCDKLRETKLYSDLASGLAQCAEAADGDPKGAFDMLKKQVAALSTAHTIDNSCDIRSKVSELRDEYFKMKSGATGLKGHAYPWKALNDSTLGLQDQQVVFFYGRPKSGKALTIDTPVLTPTGFRPIGTLHVGDDVIGSDGNSCKVTGVYPQGIKETFRVGTSDGLEIFCCDEHLWFTTTHKEGHRGVSGKARSLGEIRRSLKAADGRAQHRLPVVAPVSFAPSTVDLPLDPWLLGALLGDGCFVNDITFCKPEDDVMAKVIDRLPAADASTYIDDHRAPSIRIKRRVRNNDPSDTLQALRALELHGLRSADKFIPRIYLMASVDERLALLQGLMDTDGSVAGAAVEYSTSSSRLAEDVAFLARSLGAMVTTRLRGTSYPYMGEIRQGLDSHRLRIRFNDNTCPVTSEKHLARWRFNGKSKYRTITSVQPAGKSECVCISVDASDRLFVTKDFLVTHNTWLGLEVMRNFHAMGLRPIIFSQEMSDIEICRRFVALSTGVDYNAYLRGQLDGQTERDFLDNLDAFVESESVIVDMITSVGEDAVLEMSTKIDEYKANVVLVDAVYALGQDWKELVAVMAGMKRIAKVKRIPILGTTQANRSGSAKNKKVDDAADDFAYADAFYQWCTGVDTLVLDGNLNWVRVGDLKAGSPIVGFEEEMTNEMRRWQPATVTHHEIRNLPAYRLTMESGTTLVTTVDHQSLAYDRSSCLAWMTTEEIKRKVNNGGVVRLPRFMKPGEHERFPEHGAGVRARWKDRVVSAERIGLEKIAVMSTSTKTFVAEGYGAHNCDAAIRVTSDIEHKRKREAVLSTAALREGIPTTFTVNMFMANNLTQKAVLKVGGDEDLDGEIDQDALDGASDNPLEADAKAEKADRAKPRKLISVPKAPKIIQLPPRPKFLAAPKIRKVD